MTCEIHKRNTCVLLPREFEALIGVMPPVHRLYFSAALHTHMRLEELRWYILNERRDPPYLYYKPSRRCIALPKPAIGKTHTWFQERDVRLSIAGCQVVESLLALKLRKGDLITSAGYNKAIDTYAVKAGIGREFMCPKMFRKTWISWVVAKFPQFNVWINASAGHTSPVQLRHYVGIAFSDEDMKAMDPYVAGWAPA